MNLDVKSAQLQDRWADWPTSINGCHKRFDCRRRNYEFTPHINRLASQGIRFDIAVSNNPVCMPSRSTLLTGQYSRSCMGYLGNYVEEGVLPEYPSLARTWLRDTTLPASHLVGFDYAFFPRVNHRHTW